MPKASRDKGKRGEREFELEVLERYGLEYVREQDGRPQGADFRVEGSINVDSKRRERVRVIEWAREVEASSPDHVAPAIAYRSNREPWRVSMLASDWAELVKRSIA